MQLAEDDKVRYKNEISTWEHHMIELGREDLIRRKKKSTKKVLTKKIRVVKSKATVKKTDEAKTKKLEKTVKSQKSETEK